MSFPSVPAVSTDNSGINLAFATIPPKRGYFTNNFLLIEFISIKYP